MTRSLLLLPAAVAAFAAAPDARADDAQPPAPPAAPELAQPPVPSDPAAAVAPEQAADTAQDAVAGATAAQPQQSNSIVIVRINSPGNDVVSQTNVVIVDAAAENRSATKQSRAPVVALMRASAAPRTAQPAARAAGDADATRPPRSAAPAATAPELKRAQPAARTQTHRPKPPKHARPAQRTHVHYPPRAPERATAAQPPAATWRALPHHPTDRDAGVMPRTAPRSAPLQVPVVEAELPVRSQAPTPQVAAETEASDRSGLGTAALAALLAGLLGCAGLSWLAHRRRVAGARA